VSSVTCQVDFYVLARPEQSAQRLACKLAMMAWEQGHHVAVLTADENEADSLDEIMWDYPPGRFLPHSRGAADPETPVSIDTCAVEIPADRDVVINLADTAVPEPGRFKRLLEIVPGVEQKRLACRQKFREYRELGLSLASHTIGK
jgi:DNA polymerase-3 subunit chi